MANNINTKYKGMVEKNKEEYYVCSPVVGNLQ